MATVKRVLQTAGPLIPPTPTLPALRKAAATCKACDLWKRGTQTVFGEGARNAQVMFVGEQPGNDEDLAGHPFVGPAGKLLDRALEEAGIDRGQAYVTNVVKHFKWVPKGKRRIHAKPDVHPSSILRAPDDETRRAERARFVADLKRVAKALAGGRPAAHSMA